jgi:hypothetical protein
MTNNKHLFLDFSMLGYYPEDCVILDCSASVIDTSKMLSDNPYTVKSAFASIRRMKFDLADQKAHGFRVYADGLEFWKGQPKALIERTLKSTPQDVTVVEFAQQFIEFISTHGNIDKWWSWNTMDDAAILWRLFRAVEKEPAIREYLPRWKSRDFATFLDTTFEFKLKKLDIIPIEDAEYWKSIYTKGDSTIEVMANILRFQAALRAQNDLENISK